MNAALWLAAGAAAGVLLGVTMADRSGGRKLLRRLNGALGLLERFGGAGAVGTGPGRRGAERMADVPADQDLDDDDMIEYAESVGEEHDEFLHDDEFEPEEDEGAGYEPDTFGSHIDERVLTAFEQDPILRDRDIEIEELEPAVIALSGRVGSDNDAKHAAIIARGVPGVERVENYIKVRNRPPVSPPPEEADV